MSDLTFTFDDYEARWPEYILDWFTRDVLPDYTRRLGPIRVIARDLQRVQGIASYDRGAWLITVNSRLRGRSLASVLAHELGHIAAGHISQEWQDLATATQTDETRTLTQAQAARGHTGREWDADRFAEGLLQTWEARLTAARVRAYNRLGTRPAVARWLDTVNTLTLWRQSP